MREIRDLLNGSEPKLKDGFTGVVLNPIIPIDKDSLLRDYDRGKIGGETAHFELKDSDSEILFRWKKGFINCWTGWPNDGKTDFFNQMAAIKALNDKWKFAIWSPEMYGSEKIEGRVVISANDLVDDIIWKLYGQCPIKNIAEKYGNRLSRSQYIDGILWVQDHFVFLKPENRSPEGVINAYKKAYDLRPFDGLLVDPFKNIVQDSGERTDRFLEEAFAGFKELSMEMDVSFNIIAHPKANIQTVKNDGTRIICDQYLLSGGAAWNNSMDGIYSIFRPFKHQDPKSRITNFINLKQRKQHLVAVPGTCENIIRDMKTSRYLIEGLDPFTNKKMEIKKTQDGLPVSTSSSLFEQNNKQAPF